MIGIASDPFPGRNIGGSVFAWNAKMKARPAGIFRLRAADKEKASLAEGLSMMVHPERFERPTLRFVV